MLAQSSQEESQYLDPNATCFSEYGAEEVNQILETLNKQSSLRNPKNANFYDEYDWLISQMINHAPGSATDEVLAKLCHVSELADEVLTERRQSNHESTMNISKSENLPMLSINDLLLWKRSQDRKHELYMSQQGALQVKDAEMFIKNRIKNQSEKKLRNGANYWQKSKPKVKEITYKVTEKNRGNKVTKPREGKKQAC